MTKTHHPTRPPHLLHPGLIASGGALLIAAFVTDIFYSQTYSSEWETFSIWLLTGGLILAGLSGLALLVDLALRRVSSIVWWRFVALTVAALLSLLNAFIHSRDSYTAVVPQGLELSGLVTVILLIIGWRGWSLSGLPRANPSQTGKARP